MPSGQIGEYLSLPEILFDLLEVSGARPAAGGMDRSEWLLCVGRLRLLLRLLLHLTPCDPLVDVHRRLLPHLVGDVGVGVQGGGGGDMADDGGERLDVHPVFQGHGGKSMPQIMKSDSTCTPPAPE